MLEYINEKYNIKINMGRIFFKDYRDPRYEEYFNRDWTPKYNTSYLNIILDKYNINEVEIDVTHQGIDVSKFKKIIVGIHTPYTYMTTGKICEYASTFSDVNRKFRPSISCNRECNKMCISYNLNDNKKWIRIGKTIFFKNNFFKLHLIHRFILMMS